MVEMLDSLLAVARMEAGSCAFELQSEAVDEIIKETALFLQPLLPEGVELKTDCDKTLVVHCDKNMTRRILINLGENALRQVSVNGGHITIMAKDDGNHVRFQVQDNGRGIPSESLCEIFEKFSQLGFKAQSTYGLGLTFCKMAVEEQGGLIGVESELGEGSTFHFTLPKKA